MGFSESIDALKQVEGADAYVSEILAHVEALKQENIAHRKKAGEHEAKASKVQAIEQALSQAGWTESDDVSAWIGSKVGGAEKKVSDSERKLSAIEKQLSEMRANNEALSAKAKRKAAEAAFSGVLRENFYNGDSVVLRSMIADGVIGIDEDEKPFVKIGEDIYDIAAGVQKLRDLPDYRDGAKNKQSGGAGSQNAGGGVQNKIMTHSAFIKLDNKTQAAFMANGGVLKG